MASPIPLLPSRGLGQQPLRVLTIAGTDSGGGAGIAADTRTFAMCGVHACVAVAAVTVQNTLGVSAIHEVPADIVAAQIRSVTTDIGIQAAKTGMLASTSIVEAVAGTCREVGIGQGDSTPLVVDPVCASMHGDSLLRPDALAALRETLVPLATVITPNLDEIGLLVDVEVVDESTAREAARALHDLGPQWVLVKGGHQRGASESTDYLFDGDTFHEFRAQRIPTANDHGGGDTLAAAIAAALAHGYAVPEAVEFAKQWVTQCLLDSYDLGGGHGPVSALWRLQ